MQNSSRHQKQSSLQKLNQEIREQNKIRPKTSKSPISQIPQNEQKSENREN